MNPKINRKLNLVIPLVRDSDGAEIYVHSTPVGPEVFDRHFLVIGKTFAALGELGLMVGPRVADKMLKKVAQDLGVWDTPDGVERTLVNEMRRLTNVMHCGDKGWDSMPFDDACKRQIVEPADEAEVMAALTFFTVASCTLRRHQHAMLADSMSLWGAQIESLACMDFLRSLSTSNAAASSGVKAA